MAQNESAQDRTEPATEKKLSEARSKADVPRSRELNTLVMLIASLVGMSIFGSTATESYQFYAEGQWQVSRNEIFDDLAVLNGLHAGIVNALVIVIPFLFLMFASVFVGPFLMGGMVFSHQAVKFDVRKLNPLTGIKRIFGIQGLAELGKSLLKVFLIGGVAIISLVYHLDDYLLIGELPIRSALLLTFKIFFEISILMVTAMAVITLVDVPYQRWSHGKKLRMTKQEVREESKETNGNPEVKQKIRSLQQSVAGRRMLLDVPGADVVIVNPEHYSVALKYAEGDSAPIVVAKGIDHMAFRIRELAKISNVEIFSAPPLARTLYRHVEIGKPIPTELFLAVAQILAYILQVKEVKYSERRFLKAPADISIPESYQVPS